MRVLIADDHVLFAEAIRVMLERSGHEVTTIAYPSIEARERARTSEPDIVLIDVEAAEGAGLRLGELIRTGDPEVKLVALTTTNDASVATEALRIGFNVVLTKQADAADFIAAVEAIAGGHVVPLVGTRGQPQPRVVDRGTLDLAEQLTPREREVLVLLTEGVRGPEISEQLGIAPNTVRTHVQSIFSKLHVHSRLEAAAYAMRHGIVDAPRQRHEGLG